VFCKPLKESLRFASVQISTANANGELYVWGYIPVVVAKWCVGLRLVVTRCLYPSFFIAVFTSKKMVRRGSFSLCDLNTA
jgi:hypothetical protein